MMFARSVFAVGLVAVAVTDLRDRRLPNALTLPLAIAGLLAAAWAHGWAGLGGGLLGILVGGLVLLYPFARGWLGGGDVKLAAALGAWLGPVVVAVAVAGGFVVGALMGLILLLGDRALGREVFCNLIGALFSVKPPRAPDRRRFDTVPLGAALALSAAALACVQGLP